MYFFLSSFFFRLHLNVLIEVSLLTVSAGGIQAKHVDTCCGTFLSSSNTTAANLSRTCVTTEYYELKSGYCHVTPVDMTTARARLMSSLV